MIASLIGTTKMIMESLALITAGLNQRFFLESPINRFKGVVGHVVLVLLYKRNKGRDEIVGKRLFIKVFGDMAEYFGMFSDDYMKIDPEKEKILDGADLHCMYVCQDLSDGCNANCAYCTQAYNSKYPRKETFLINKYMIKYPMKKFIELIRDGFLEKKEIKRICFSALHNIQTKDNALEIFRLIRSVSAVPITACYIPDSKEVFYELKEAGVDRISVNYEVATEDLFEKYRGKYRENSPYSWAIMNQAIDDALEVFGHYNVGTHLLIGLGETQEQALREIQNIYDRKVDVSLFAFRPVPNTDLQDLQQIIHRDFHKVQLARYLMLKKVTRFENMKFNAGGEIIDYGIERHLLMELVNSGTPFRNSGGCPNCNRVYYETDVKQRYYNYPRDLYQHEIDIIKSELFD